MSKNLMATTAPAYNLAYLDLTGGEVEMAVETTCFKALEAVAAMTANFSADWKAEFLPKLRVRPITQEQAAEFVAAWTASQERAEKAIAARPARSGGAV